MKFKEAYALLEEGKKIRRKSWEATFYFCNFIDDEGEILTRMFRQETIPYSLEFSAFSAGQWFIRGDKEKDFSFLDALYLLKNRREIQHLSWDDSTYIKVNESGNDIVMCRTCFFNTEPSYADLIADDWEEYL